jgi:hypothetical protein
VKVYRKEPGAFRDNKTGANIEQEVNKMFLKIFGFQ